MIATILKLYLKNAVIHKKQPTVQATPAAKNCKENSYQLQNVLENSAFSTKVVNYNEKNLVEENPPCV